jgi:hypothetical protein
MDGEFDGQRFIFATACRDLTKRLEYAAFHIAVVQRTKGRSFNSATAFGCAKTAHHHNARELYIVTNMRKVARCVHYRSARTQRKRPTIQCQE